MKIPKTTKAMPMCHRSFAIVPIPAHMKVPNEAGVTVETHTFKSVPCFGAACALFATTFDEETGEPTGGMCADLLSALAAHRTAIAVEGDDEDEDDPDGGGEPKPLLDPKSFKPIA